MANTDIDKLRAWAARDDTGLNKEYEEGKGALANLIALLGDSKLQQQKATRENFVATVRRLDELMRAGSRALGDALAEAGEHKDKGEVDQATQILEAFVRSCPSKFYADIARDYIARHLKR